MRILTNKTNSKLCSLCGEQNTNICCGKCEEVWYCCKEHQKEDWNEHSQSCKAYRIVSSPETGKYLLASRQVKAGTVVMTDVPIVIGPTGTSDLICLGCHSPIDKEDFYKCPDCKWPMCSLECARLKCHDDECDILSRDETQSGAPQTLGATPRYDLILVIRCLLLMHKSPHLWEVLISMSSHGEKKMMEGDLYQFAAVRYLKDNCKIDFEEEVIHFVRGIILTNVIQIRGPKGSCLRALYPDIRLMNHSCKPNIQLSSNSAGIMEARATVAIEKGTELTISYTEIDVPLWERQACLSSAHYFTCACERCRDPTEYGTWFSSCRCPQCPNELLLPIWKDGNTVWNCKSCKTETIDEEVIQEVSEWMFRLEMNELFGSGTPFKISGALVQIEKHFHTKHYVYLKACQLAIRKLAYNDSISACKLKIHLWEQLLELYSHLEPGITRRRGMILNELAEATHNMTKADSAFEELSREQIHNLLLESERLFNESFQILRLEPKGSPEAALSLTALKKLEEINKEILLF